jgi:hypothetical protein
MLDHKPKALVSEANMMSKTYEQQKLQPSFTFRIVEMVKRIKIKPAPSKPLLPVGLSAATGIVLDRNKDEFDGDTRPADGRPGHHWFFVVDNATNGATVEINLLPYIRNFVLDYYKHEVAVNNLLITEREQAENRYNPR